MRERRTEDKGREGERAAGKGPPAAPGGLPGDVPGNCLPWARPVPHSVWGAARTGEPHWAARRPDGTCSHPWIKTPTTNPEADRPCPASVWWTDPHHSPCPIPLRGSADPGTTVPWYLMHLGAGYLPSSPLATVEGPGGPGTAQGSQVWLALNLLGAHPGLPGTGTTCVASCSPEDGMGIRWEPRRAWQPWSVSEGPTLLVNPDPWLGGPGEEGGPGRAVPRALGFGMVKPCHHPKHMKDVSS